MDAMEVPTEILGEIFYHYVHDHPKVQRVDEVQTLSRRIAAYPNSQTHPMDLTHVCRLWRATAISIPCLWATIHVDRPRSEGDVKMFEIWLELSAGLNGSYPLNLTIKHNLYFFPWGDKKAPSGPLKQIVSLAVSQQRRWRNITLDLPPSTARSFEPLYSAVPRLPILRALTISLRDWSRDPLRELVNVLCSPPALQSITVGSGFIRSRATHALLDVVPWDRFTTLGFTSFLRQKNFFSVLSFSMDTLLHMSVTKLHSPYLISGWTDVPQLTMRYLQSMHIDKFTGTDPFAGDPTTTFDKLTLPSLRELRLPNGFGRSEEIEIQKRGWETLLQLLDRSDCKLQSFEFGAPGSPSAEDLLTQNLKSSPLFGHLTYLRVTSAIGHHPDSPQFLDALREVHGSGDTKGPAMLPLLETLILDSVFDDPANVTSVDGDVYRGVREMVSARVAAYGRRGMSKLRRVSAQLVGGDFKLEIDLTGLQRCV